MTKRDIFSSDKDVSDILFEQEQDNQYRNNIELNLQYISIISQVPKKETIIEFCKIYYQSLIEKLEQSDVKDRPLGTFSDPYSFSIVVIFGTLINIYLPENAGEFNNTLQKHNIHPMVLQYNNLNK